MIKKKTALLKYNRPTRPNGYTYNIPFIIAIHTLLKNTWNILRIENMLEQKKSLFKFKKIKTILCFLSDHNGIKQEINSRRKTWKLTNMCIVKNMPPNNKWVKEEIQREIKKYFETN